MFGTAQVSKYSMYHLQNIPNIKALVLVVSDKKILYKPMLNM